MTAKPAKLSERQSKGLFKLEKLQHSSTNKSTLKYFSNDISYHPGQAPLLVYSPETEQQVKIGLMICNQHGLTVTTSAGKSSLEGGTIPSNYSTVVFDMSMMDNIKVNKDDLDAVIGPGVTTNTNPEGINS
jgi:D-lactate dehydrogenase (cytochrome)